MAQRSVVLPLVVIAAAGALIYGGIANPAGGVFAGIGRALKGKPARKAGADPASFASTIADLTNLGTTNSGAGGGPATPASTGSQLPANASEKRAKVLAVSRGWLGVPYAWGGESRAGVDCSGLTMQVYSTVGVHLPHLSAAQQSMGVGRKLAQAQPGDLVFFGVPAHHVGIYLGNNTIRHAPHPGTVVRDERIWRGEIITVRDVLSHKRHHPGSVAV